ncbi:MAG: hypothetical protein QM209_05435 [Candidatus Cloacimonadota bacterium]|jgi:hypothetical protein|nr:hypothetical protein [Candidatus Cloacimonas sp.]MDD3606473.1 hypothetical protein [Candidatus Cloacimonas acidaminovorans]MDI9572609.1 hypothetical protein [Candidatus Cloacimonadota bacterium]OQC70613.1 MAG: hypothetical protein BWX46_00733 [Candidatus Cloacimonetes bacterium ADurb.Bin003]MDD5407642.1 hypothetical protein [Candidatus Cloacimonas acidaminovorans]
MKDNKEIAAIGAVIALIQSEETSITYKEPVRGTPSQPYTAYGRELTMHYRDLTQRRIIKRCR